MVAIETCILPRNVQGNRGHDAITREWIERAKDLGFSGVVVDITNGQGLAMANSKENEAKDPSGPSNPVVYPTIYSSDTIIIQDRNNIKNVLSGLRDRLGVDLLRIRSSTPEVLNFVAKDSRVDAIQLVLPDEFTAFNEGVASLAGQSGTFIDLPFLPLLQSRGSARAKHLRAMSKAIELCLANNANILCSSFASKLVDMKGPWQKSIVLHELVGLSKQESKKIVFTNSQLLVNRNADKLQGVVVLDDGGG